MVEQLSSLHRPSLSRRPQLLAYPTSPHNYSIFILQSLPTSSLYLHFILRVPKVTDNTDMPQLHPSLFWCFGTILRGTRADLAEGLQPNLAEGHEAR